jgi:hypothetical protein
MENVSIVGLDLAKNVFQAHGARSDGTVVFREKISRAKLLRSSPPFRNAWLPWKPVGPPIIGHVRLARLVTRYV